MKYGVFGDIAGCEDTLTDWRHCMVGVDKLDSVWEFAKVGVEVSVIRSSVVPW